MLLPFQGANPNIHSPRALPWAGCLLAFASRWSATFGWGRYFSKTLPDSNNTLLTLRTARQQYLCIFPCNPLIKKIRVDTCDTLETENQRD